MMEDTSDMSLDLLYDRDVRSTVNNHATPAHVDASQTDQNDDGSPMNWTPTILGDGEQPPASMPTINSAYHPRLTNNKTAGRTNNAYTSSTYNAAAGHTNYTHSSRSYIPSGYNAHRPTGRVGAIPIQSSKLAKKSMSKAQIADKESSSEVQTENNVPRNPIKRKGRVHNIIQSAMQENEDLELKEGLFVSTGDSSDRRHLISNRVPRAHPSMPGAWPASPAPKRNTTVNQVANGQATDDQVANDQDANDGSGSTTLQKTIQFLSGFLTSFSSNNNTSSSTNITSSTNNISSSSNIITSDDDQTFSIAESETGEQANHQALQSRDITSNQGRITQNSGSKITSDISQAPPSLKQKKENAKKRVLDAEEGAEDLTIHKARKSNNPTKPRIRIDATFFGYYRYFDTPSRKSKKSQTPPSLKEKKENAKKRALEADEKAEDLIIHKKARKGSNPTKSRIQIKVTGDSLEKKVPQELPAMKSRFDKTQPQRLRIAEISGIAQRKKSTSIERYSSLSAPVKVSNKNIDTLTAQTNKGRKIMDLTRPNPAQNTTQVQASNDGQGDFQKYRESEERPSTSSSGSSEEDKQCKTHQKTTKQFAGNANDGWGTPIFKASKPPSKDLDQQIEITKWGMNVGNNVNLRATGATQLEELMERATVEDGLEVSDSRKDTREEELERQRMAEAEEKRKAEEAAAAAKRKAEEEKRAAEDAKAETRRKILSQGPTNAEEEEIRSVLAGRNPMAELQRNFTVRDLNTLVPNTTWLNDSLINKYLEELTKKACEKEGYGEREKKAGKAPPYQCLISNWWVDAHQKGVEKTLSWNRRSRLHEGRLLLVKALFIPICHGAHWRLVVVSGTKRTIEYFDSLSGSARPFVAKALEWVRATLGSAFDAQEWCIIEGQRSPRQSNSDDCGVFTLQNARAVALGLDVRPNLYVTSTEGVLRVRHQMAAQLLSGGMDWE